MAVVNVRDAVTEAALAIGQKAVACQSGLRRKVDLIGRQLMAEKNKGAKGTPKLVAIEKQHRRLGEALRSTEELTGTLFNSVFVHRFKDSHDNVRALCVRRLGDWLSADPVKMYKDEYVKYAGWATYDHAAVVRREAVRSLGKLLLSPDDVMALTGFFDRFMERFIEVAVGDVDESISLEMLRVMRGLQS